MTLLAVIARFGADWISAIESLLNAVVGLVVSWALTRFWLGFDPVDSAGITAVFFVASFARGWVVRAAFKRLSA